MLDLLPTLQVLIVPEPLWHYLDVNGINKSELLSTDFLLRNNGVENTAMLFYVNSLYNSPVFKNKFDFSHYPETYKYPTSVTSSLDLQQLQSRVEGMQLEAKDFYDFFPTTVNTFRPFMISERVVGLIPITDLETNFKQRLDGFFGVLRACNVPTTLLAKLPYFKQHIHESKQWNDCIVSTEDLGTIIVGGVLLSLFGVGKILDIVEKRKAKADLTAKQLKEVNSIEQRVKNTLTKVTQTKSINPTAETQGFFLGSPKGSDASEIIVHLNKNVIGPTTKLLDKVENQFIVLRKLSDRWEDNETEDSTLEDELDAESMKMMRLWKSVIGNGMTINGLKFTLLKDGIPNRDPDYSPNTKTSTLKTPTEKQFSELASILGIILDLFVRTKALPIVDYAQAETFWIRELENMLEDTLVALITYLNNSIN